MSHPLRDVWLIYPSGHERGKCVAHSLYTDQIGVGDSVLDAYIELFRAVRALLAETRRDERVKVFQPAPERVWRMLERAEPLPKEIVQIAHRMLHRGKRPRVEFPLLRKPRMVLPPRELLVA
jgi:hypothetical protein